MLRLPEEVRQSLKRPLGELFRTTEEAVERLRKASPARLITVGDIVTAEFLRAGLKPDVVVVDFMVMRSSAREEIKRTIDAYSTPVRRVKNPAGILTPGLREELEGAALPLKIVVDGEEDLATLPAVLAAPVGSIVAYGQPGEGLVLVEVTEGKKQEFQELLSKFKSDRV
ncbi:MAG: DUF359 domain-containing protein [Candidatus Hadarchaeota archaeon]|nr:DUF359 domain-containing protein [Candidatus Hadarchaeota archaeon]